MNDLKQKIIDRCKKAGADIVRFGNAGRFADKTVKLLFPEAKTVICIAARSLRGSRRGIEEGTTYHHFTTVGLETLEETVLPTSMLWACNILEDAGFDALPQRRNQLVMAEENSTNTNEEKHYNTAYQLTEDDIFQMNNGDAAMLFLFLRFFYASVPMHACAAFMTAYLPCSYVSPPWKKTV